MTRNMIRLICDSCDESIDDEWDSPAAARECMAHFGWGYCLPKRGDDRCPNCAIEAGDIRQAEVPESKIRDHQIYLAKIFGDPEWLQVLRTSDGYFRPEPLRPDLLLTYRREELEHICFRTKWGSSP